MLNLWLSGMNVLIFWKEECVHVVTGLHFFLEPITKCLSVLTHVLRMQLQYFFCVSCYRFRLREMAVRSWLRWIWMPQLHQFSWTTWPLEVLTLPGLWHTLVLVWDPSQLRCLLLWTQHNCISTLPGEVLYFPQNYSVLMIMTRILIPTLWLLTQCHDTCKDVIHTALNKKHWLTKLLK